MEIVGRVGGEPAASIFRSTRFPPVLADKFISVGGDERWVRLISSRKGHTRIDSQSANPFFDLFYFSYIFRINRYVFDDFFF